MYTRLLTALFLPTFALAQTQIDIQQSRYLAPGNSAVARSATSKLNDIVSVKDFGATGNGSTDDLPAINAAIAAVSGSGQRLLFPAGTFAVSNTVVIPSKTVIVGIGRGDAGGLNTVIKALPAFPSGGTLVQMGSAAPSYGVRVENMTLDGSAIAGICLANQYAQEQSAGRDLLLANCGQIGLSISTSGAQNSGPFQDLEIRPGSGSTVNGATMCVQVQNVGSFRGVKGLTCNAGTAYATRPSIALAIDGGGTFSDINVQHFTTAISLGSSVNAAAGMVVSNGQFGPDVATGIAITAPAAMSNQNISISGLSCGGCTSLLLDGESGTNITSTSLGLYVLGDGSGNSKGLFSTSNGIGESVYGPFHTFGKASFGPSNTSSTGTLNIYDATANTGATSVIETAGANQTGTNLFEWHNNWNQTMAYVDAGGGMTSSAFIALNGASALGTNGSYLANNASVYWSSTSAWSGTPDTGLSRSSAGVVNVTNGSTGLGSLNAQSIQVSSTGTQPACSATTRGTFWFVQGANGAADHLQVCAKSASNSYSWTTVF